MRLVIDRFEGNYAILIDDNENSYNVDKKLLINNHEGDVIYITYNEEETKKRKEEITNLVDKLFE